jgi:hypothetical protein
MLVVVAGIGLAGCNTMTPTGRTAVVGGATGAAIGGIATRSVGGALVGGGIGALAGAAIGSNYERRCTYYDRRGRAYVARC